MSTDGSTPSGLTPLARDSRHESATMGRRVATEPVEMNVVVGAFQVAPLAARGRHRWAAPGTGPAARLDPSTDAPDLQAAQRLCGAMTATFLSGRGRQRRRGARSDGAHLTFSWQQASDLRVSDCGGRACRVTPVRLTVGPRAISSIGRAADS